MKNYAVLADLRAKATFHIEKAFDRGYDQGYNDCKVELTEEAKAHYNEGYKDGTKVKDGERGRVYHDGYGDGLKYGYEEGLQHGKELRVKEADCAYQCGLRIAWNAARKIVLSSKAGGLEATIVREIFGMPYESVLMKYSAKNTIEMIEAWEKKQKENEKVDCNNTDCKNCINHNDCDYEDEKQEQTEKNCDNCGHHGSGDVGCEAWGCSLIRENWIPQEKQEHSNIVPESPLVSCYECVKYPSKCGVIFGGIKLHCTAWEPKDV